MEYDPEKKIRKLKTEIWILRIILFLIIAAIVSATIVGYIYVKPYIEKFDDFATQLQNAQPYLNQISQSPLISQDIKSVINNFKDFPPIIEKIQSFTNLLPR